MRKTEKIKPDPNFFYDRWKKISDDIFELSLQ